jgi:hypothetical protein
VRLHHSAASDIYGLFRVERKLTLNCRYYLTAVEQLWKSVDSLLSRERCADGSPPLFILAHVNREKVIDSGTLSRAPTSLRSSMSDV